MEVVSIKKTNSITTNVTKNCHSKIVRDCYTLLLIITIICNHCAKQKAIGNIKMENL